MRELTNFSLCEIGSFYGLDHGTIIHAQRKVSELVGCYPNLKAAIDEIRTCIIQEIRKDPQALDAKQKKSFTAAKVSVT